MKTYKIIQLLLSTALFASLGSIPLRAQEPEVSNESSPQAVVTAATDAITQVNVIQFNKISEDVYNGTGYNKKISHYDKAGRLLQTINIGASPSGKNVINFYEYDCMGRADSISYLPYTSTTGGGELISNPKEEQRAFYQSLFPSPDDYNYAYTSKKYAAAPFNQVMKEGGAGKKYTANIGYPAHCTSYTYGKNADNEVYKYVIGAAGTVSATQKYPANSLSKSESSYNVGANPIKTVHYKDASGKLIAKSVNNIYDGTTYTYYVYDDMDRLRYIVPDVAHQKIKDVQAPHSHEAYRKYWYYYEYDSEGRVIMSIKPGKADEYFVYDGKGRLVMTQDGNMREEKRWLYRSYDALGRETGSMLITDTGSAPLSRAEIQTLFNNDNFPGVTSSSRFRMLYTLENKFYDRYTEFSPHSFVPVEGIATADMLAQSNVGRLLYEILSILPYDDTNKLPGHVYRTYYYDKKGRLLQTVVDDTPTNTTSRYTNKYDLAGNVVATVESHTDGTTTNTKRTDFTYDKFGRLLSEKTTVNTSDPVTVSYTYDELGNMASKTLGSSGVTETYAYNLQGMLTSQDSKRMKMDYTYDTSVAGYDNTPRYDGNLSMVRWQYKTTEPKEEAYVYTYDKKGQLAGGKYYSAGTATGIYDENVQYDANGNITRMQRMGSSADWNTDYSYNYDGNQISSINYTERTKTGTYTFTHDANGNMTNNPRRGWNYLYNHLNLLSHIVDPDAGLLCYYMWLADGTKYGVQQVQAGYTTRIYKGSFTYKGTTEADAENVSFSGGEFLATASGFTPNYVLSDRLGSTRVVMDSKGSTIVRNSYYPFGLTHYDYLYTEKLLSSNRYHFNGKEKQTFSTQIDYELLDYGSRMYNPYLCRWTTQDPEYQFINPYIFSGNNPANYIDPDGKFISEIIAGFFIGAMTNLLINGLAGNGPETGRQLIGQILSGGLAGAAGSAVFLSVMSALPAMNVFLSGAIGGGASGMAAGFIGAAGNALTYGAHWTTAIANGIIGGAIGIPLGAASGALGNALNAWLCGADFKTGNITFEDIDYSITNTESLITEKYLDDQYDGFLQDKLQELGLTKYSKFYNKATTAASEGYEIVISDGPHFNKFRKSNGTLINGYTTMGMYDSKANIHISPYNVFQASELQFKATFFHELTHAFHFMNLGYNGLTSEQKKRFMIYSERVAYHNTVNLYLRNGAIADVYSTIKGAASMGFWGTAPTPFTYTNFLSY